MFLVSDDFGNNQVLDYLGLKDMLIDEIVEDTKQNYTEYDIVRFNVNQLGELAKGITNVNVKYLKDNLQSYGWYVQDFSDMQRDINNLREYLVSRDKNVKAFDEILDLLDKGVR